MKQPRTPDPVVIAFRANQELVAALDAAAEKEGLKRADVARRAVLRDMKRESDWK